MRNILLLTSTIQPKIDQPDLKLTNPQERLSDYKKAIGFYSDLLKKEVIDGIVFVDNSGFDLKCLSDIFTSKNIEWISFYGLDYPATFHRGYGEFKLIDYAFANSVTLNGLNKTDRIWKVTGRYIIKNLNHVILFSPRKFDLYCDIQKNWIDMAVISWSLTGYERSIKGMHENFKTVMAPELIMSKLIREQENSIKNNGIISNYYWMPLIIGKRGGDGGQFLGKYTYIKYMLFSFVNILKLPYRYFF